ncbi:adenylate/guanylate cyclase domain-containing protein [Primorskyibacter sp. S87]|uniref:adenylate/guanylate cyclase domain-containing protein n=1 Tax=Primorskyibacter sp. S87 TaxID=3415126 RepID=UPI003C7EBA85
MLIEALSSRLLKSIGVGICLVDEATLSATFCNPTFATWFPGAEPGIAICDLIEDLEPEILTEANPARALELKTRIKRRTLIIETRVHRTEHEGRTILLLECQNVSRLRETEAMIDSYVAMADRRTRDLEREKAQSEKLLLNIMPRTVYEEYKSFGSVTPRLFEPVSVLMLDFVGFTEMAAAADPTVTVAELNDIFTAFDRIGELHGCERIKTVGDCYMAVAGLPHPNPDHGRSAAQCAVKMMRYLQRRNETHPHHWRARIGIASGSVVGSVVGVQKYIYDVFGPAVNYAARLQSLSGPMEITVCTSMTGELIDDFVLSNSRKEQVQGFGECAVATLTDRKSAAHAA